MQTHHTPVLELYNHTYQGIHIGVQIDYRAKQITIVDLSNVSNKHNYPEGGIAKVKKWEFKDRGLEYMNGWRQLLAAIESAIGNAETKLKAWEAIEQERVIALADAVNEELSKK